MGHIGYVVIGWITAAIVMGISWSVWRVIQRLIEWSTYWHEQWLELGKLHASDLDKWTQSVEELEKTREEVKSLRGSLELVRESERGLFNRWTEKKAELDRVHSIVKECVQCRPRVWGIDGVGGRRDGEKADVPVLWPGAAGGMVSAIWPQCERGGEAGVAVPGVSAAVGQFPPGEAPWGGSFLGIPVITDPSMGPTERALRRVPPAADESVSRGPQGGGGERGAARGVESAVAAPAVQSPEGAPMTHEELTLELAKSVSERRARAEREDREPI